LKNKPVDPHQDRFLAVEDKLGFQNAAAAHHKCFEPTETGKVAKGCLIFGLERD